jgi:membrane protein implicated in regulation of membrane protease activity
MKYAKFLIPFAALAALALFFASGAPAIFGINVGGVGGIGLPGLNLTSQDTITIVLILVFLLIVVYMTRGEEKEKGKPKGGQGPSYEVEGTKYSA